MNKWHILFALIIVFTITSYLTLDEYFMILSSDETPPTIYEPISHMTQTAHNPAIRRVLLFGYCIHYHDFDAKFAEYASERLPNSEFYTVDLQKYKLNQSMAQLNHYATSAFNLTAHIDKWQWVLFPTCGQYKNNLYMSWRRTIQQSQQYVHNNEQNITFPVSNEWFHDVYWPNTSHAIPLSHPSRPLIVAMSGEVFWEHNYGSGDNIDFELMRSRGHPKTKAFTGHWLQGAKQFYRRSHNNNNDRSLQALEVISQQRSDSEWNALYRNKTGFCVMIVKSVYQRGKYFPDALVRHTMFRLLSKQYKQCDSLGQSYSVPDGVERCDAKLADVGTFLCMKPYKFSITMENTLRAGYLSEKIFNGVFADTVPIYFGLPDVAQYNVNVDRFVYCNVSMEVMERMRGMQRQNGKVWLFQDGNENPSDEELLDWAEQMLAGELQTCVDQVIALDQDQDLYMTKLKQSIFKTGSPRHSEFDGYTLGQGFADVLETLQSYLFEDL